MRRERLLLSSASTEYRTHNRLYLFGLGARREFYGKSEFSTLSFSSHSSFSRFLVDVFIVVERSLFIYFFPTLIPMFCYCIVLWNIYSTLERRGTWESEFHMFATRILTATTFCGGEVNARHLTYWHWNLKFFLFVKFVCPITWCEGEEVKLHNIFFPFRRSYRLTESQRCSKKEQKKRSNGSFLGRKLLFSTLERDPIYMHDREFPNPE